MCLTQGYGAAAGAVKGFGPQINGDWFYNYYLTV